MPEQVDHVEATVQQMAKLHSEHEMKRSPLQRVADRVTDRLGRPSVVLLIIAFEGLWIALNLAPGSPFPRLKIDEAPFSILNLVVSALALNVTLLILTTQRRDDIAARHRSQLTLQLAALSEQKIAKVISLLEEQRHDNPTLKNRTDSVAEAMSVAADPGHVLDRIIDTHEG
jgi:uncharacterized membrane protein